MTVYEENGYQNRREYLECLADDFDLPIEVVFNTAELLGADEDFDGLLNCLELATVWDW